jgi:hypothetical protein
MRAGFTPSVNLREGRLCRGINRWQSQDVAKNHRVLAGGNTGLDVGGMLGGTVCRLAGQKRLASGVAAGFSESSITRERSTARSQLPIFRLRRT